MAKALSIIPLSLPNKVLREVWDLGSVPEVWKKLESLYLQKSLTKRPLYQLRLTLGTSVGSLDTLGYKYMGKGGVLKALKGALVVMKWLLRNWLYVMSLHSISKSSKFLVNRAITFDEAALVERCKSGSQGHMEKLVKKVEFVVEEPKTPKTQHAVVEDVQIGRSKGRQHSLWNSSRTRDRQREYLRLRNCFRLAELVVSGNAEVRDTTCR
ncbi:hypothetical protein CRG98_032309 [Punica granatum]|uniref:Uncharacterized protein n=1 Tax=Punica granatum TaxID=22663 RepID=A0A2I0IUG1_PUNGR|nr:hypothetical protein CRG98_032309 [Punica granatum]